MNKCDARLFTDLHTAYDILYDTLPPEANVCEEDGFPTWITTAVDEFNYSE